MAAGSWHSIGVLCHPSLFGGVLPRWPSAVHAGLLHFNLSAVAPPFLLGPRTGWPFSHAQAAPAEYPCLPHTAPILTSINKPQPC